MTAQPKLDYHSIGDVALAQLCGSRDREAVRYLVTANNQRLFRAAWSILKDRAEAEEATLDNVRARCLRSAQAWDVMASRVQRVAEMRATLDAAKERERAGDAFM